MKETFLLVTIASLFLVGLLIALRSGAESLGTTRGLRVLGGNLSSLLLRMIGYGVGLLAIQRVLGLPSLSGW